ncbi:uncharacterized protein SAPINGB_P005749 [Magnusiomyces paraingens]|uniref:Rad60/SUMO-like domain-containing protein n=1 Tax=Magnusiomyces paraingens TaxID=2606893 RepID=A0A5E8C3K8_9ASCO|nr:uncharacterized protein SAPINGB_P005749 [Saprochaete ingens]VVT57545.1 unnamed protein product [Saprochaete ingens]
MPEPTSPKNDNIEIVIALGNSRQTYRIRSSLRFERFFEVYLSRHQELADRNLTFSFDGTVLRGSDTPESIGIYNKAVIQAQPMGVTG